ncbi:MAG: nucleotidyltransferase domain-containing protein [Deltaproteobacteria bacterium]|nr:nucleotidyltransferase domain-containing protein [Deltaproteobacteria bacterium]
MEAELSAVENAEGLRVLYACEAGSRAWGFASLDSDYDVRFLYVRPVAWYLSIDDRRDVVERPLRGLLDVTGWDLQKALRLFRKSNPPLLEWLGSPIVYREAGPLAARLRELLPRYYSPRACLHHYLHMARGNFREYLQGETVWLKKYLYVLRPLLACRWIEAGRGAVPVRFLDLLGAVSVPERVGEALGELLESKRAGQELDRGPRSPALSQFIEEEIDRLGAAPEAAPPPAGTAALDDLFRECLLDAWPQGQVT